MVELDLITGSHFMLQKQGRILGKSQSALGIKFMHHVIIMVGLFHLYFLSGHTKLKLTNFLSKCVSSHQGK